MANTNAVSAVVFITAENEVEIAPASVVLRMFSTAQEHKLLVTNERNQTMHYIVEPPPYEQDDQDKENENEERWQDFLVEQRAKALKDYFLGVLKGEVVCRVKSREAVPPTAGDLLAD